MPHSSKTDKAAYMRDYVKRNRSKINARRNLLGTGRAANRRRRDRARKLVAAYKDRPCHDCHNEFPEYVMEFDHCRGKKLFNLGSLRTLSLARIKAELDKCDVVCANCHRTREYKRRNRRKRT